MADKNYNDITFKLDNAAGTLTELTSHINTVSLAATLAMLENTTLADGEQSFLPGVAGLTLPINGFVNSTTDNIFGPLIGNRTSKSKTFQYYNGLKYYNGECFPDSVQYSGNVNTLQTFSAGLTITGAANRTSVALA